MPKYLSPETRKKLAEAGRKGGRAKVPKGFSKMPRKRYAEFNRKGKVKK
jgi:general stress protein YciG